LKGYDGINEKRYDLEVQRMNQYQKSKVDQELIGEKMKGEKIAFKNSEKETTSAAKKEA
jgi:hypothetical protein